MLTKDGAPNFTPYLRRERKEVLSSGVTQERINGDRTSETFILSAEQRLPARRGNRCLGAAPAHGTDDITALRALMSYQFPTVGGPLLALLFPTTQAAGGSQMEAFN